MGYDYKAGKKRVKDILDGSMKVLESKKLPSTDNLTFTNAYRSWISAVFVDIRDSTSLMDDDDQEYVAKVVRSFTSEIIEILRSLEDNEREIGIRGDCVYAVYTTPTKSDIYEVFQLAVWVNTYLNMLNALLGQKGYKTIEAGIGVATSRDHVIKAGRKGVNINAVVWMGEAVSGAANLSDYGEKVVSDRIVISDLTYRNIKARYEKDHPGNNWFRTSAKLPVGARCCSVIKTDMNQWIKDGMPDE